MSTGGPPEVGFYVHHVGSGHVHRACALARCLVDRGVRVTGLSSAERPSAWPGQPDAWVRLDRDDLPVPAPEADATAHGRLHWAPLDHAGLRRRTHQISSWLDAARPQLLVCDVSQEVAVLARLHGVRVVSVLLPGRRDDPAHAWGLGVSDEVVAFWPPQATGMSAGLPPDVAARVRPLGGQSRFDPVHDSAPRSRRHLVVLAGSGGGGERLVAAAEAAMRALDGWTCHVLGAGAWEPEPFSHLLRASVVLTHAGQNALAEVAATRVPAVVVPQDRPFDEQHTTAAVLRAGPWPTVVVADPQDRASEHDWADRVRRAAVLDGREWGAWVDGGTAGRFADLVASLLRTRAAVPG